MHSFVLHSLVIFHFLNSHFTFGKENIMVNTGLTGDKFSSEWCHFSTTITLFDQVIHHNDKVKPKMLFSFTLIFWSFRHLLKMFKSLNVSALLPLSNPFALDLHEGQVINDRNLVWWAARWSRNESFLISMETRSKQSPRLLFCSGGESEESVL